MDVEKERVKSHFVPIIYSQVLIMMACATKELTSLIASIWRRQKYFIYEMLLTNNCDFLDLRVEHITHLYEKTSWFLNQYKSHNIGCGFSKVVLLYWRSESFFKKRDLRRFVWRSLYRTLWVFSVLTKNLKS